MYHDLTNLLIKLFVFRTVLHLGKRAIVLKLPLYNILELSSRYMAFLQLEFLLCARSNEKHNPMQFNKTLDSVSRATSKVANSTSELI